MVMITSTPDRDALSRLDRRPISFGDAGWDTGDTSTAPSPDDSADRWSGGFGDAYDGSSYGRYGAARPPTAPPAEPSRRERIADYWRLYSGSPSAIISGMTAVGVSVAELAEATGQSADAVGRYLQAGGAADGFGGWHDPVIAAAAAAAERRSIIVTYWQANKHNPAAVILAMDTTKVSVAELAQATGQTVDQVNACLYPPVSVTLPPVSDLSTATVTAASTTATVDTTVTVTAVATDTVHAAVTADTTTSSVLAPTTTAVPASPPTVLAALPTAPPLDPMTIHAATFHAQVDALLHTDLTSQTSIWSNPDGAGPVLSLAGGQSWQPSGGGPGGSGITRYDPHTLDQAYVPTMVELDAGPRDLGTGVNPTQLFASLGMQLGRDLIGLEFGAQGFDTGESGRSEGVPVTDAARAAAYARAQARGEFDASLPLYVVTGDASDLLGQPDSRMFLSVAYQERDGQMVPVGQALNYRKSAGAENMTGLMAFASFVTMGMTGAFSGAATAGEAAAGAGFNAAADSQLANLAIEAGGGNALAGYASTALSAAVPATTAAATTGLAGVATELGTALGFTGQAAANAGNFLIKFGIQTVANGGDWQAALLSSAGGAFGNVATGFLETLPGMTETLSTVIGQAAGSVAIGQNPLQALLGSGLNEGLTGLTGQIPGFNNLPGVVKSAVITTMSGVLQGQDVSVSLLNTALTAGLDAAVRGVQAGNTTNTTSSTYANSSNHINTYGAGPVFTLGAFDEATNTWATTMGDGNDGTQGTGDWSNRDYVNGWDVQSDLAPTVDGGNTDRAADGTGVADGGDINGTTGADGSVVVGSDTGTPLKPYVVPFDGEIVNAGFFRNNGDFASSEARTINGALTRVEQPPLIPEALLPQGVKSSEMYAATDTAGNLWYFIDGIEYTPDGPDKPMHSNFFTPAAQGIVDLGLAGLESGAVTPSQYLEASRFLSSVGATTATAGVEFGLSGLSTLGANALGGARVLTAVGEFLTDAAVSARGAAAPLGDLAAGATRWVPWTLLFVMPNAQTNTVELNADQRFVSGVGDLYGNLEERNALGEWTIAKLNVSLVQVGDKFIALTPEELQEFTRPVATPLPEPQPVGPPVLPISDQQTTTTTTTPITQPVQLGPDGLPIPPPPTIDDYIVTRNADNNRDLADQRHQENPNLADPNQLIGKSGPNGIGVWVYPDQPRTPSGAEYEEQRTGKPSGIEINVGGTVVQTANGSVTATGGANFDGVRVDASGHTILIDTKDWENFVLPNKDFWVDKVVGPARAQTNVVEGAGINATIEWQVSTQAAADAIAQTLIENDIAGITVVVAPKKGP